MDRDAHKRPPAPRPAVETRLAGRIIRFDAPAQRRAPYLLGARVDGEERK